MADEQKPKKKEPYKDWTHEYAKEQELGKLPLPEAPKTAPATLTGTDLAKVPLAMGLRVAGPWAGGVLGGLVGSEGAAPLTIPAGAAIGGMASEAIAEKFLDPGNHAVNPGRVLVSGGLSAVPGSILVRSGNPLYSAATGGVMGYLGTLGNKVSEDTHPNETVGQKIAEHANPMGQDWSGRDWAMGIAVPSLIGGGLSMIPTRFNETPPPSGGAPGAPPAPKLSPRQVLEQQAKEIIDRINAKDPKLVDLVNKRLREDELAKYPEFDKYSQSNKTDPLTKSVFGAQGRTGRLDVPGPLQKVVMEETEKKANTTAITKEMSEKTRSENAQRRAQEKLGAQITADINAPKKVEMKREAGRTAAQAIQDKKTNAEISQANAEHQQGQIDDFISGQNLGEGQTIEQSVGPVSETARGKGPSGEAQSQTTTYRVKNPEKPKGGGEGGGGGSPEPPAPTAPPKEPFKLAYRQSELKDWVREQGGNQLTHQITPFGDGFIAYDREAVKADPSILPQEPGKVNISPDQSEQLGLGEESPLHPDHPDAEKEPDLPPVSGGSPDAVSPKPGSTSKALKRARPFAQLRTDEQDALVPYLEDAMNNGFKGDIEDLGDELASRYNAVKDGLKESDLAGSNSDVLLKEIRRRGGISMKGASASDLKQIKSQFQRPTSGLFTNKGGVNLDDLATSFGRESGWEHLGDSKKLLDALREAGVNEPRGKAVDNLKLNGDWWHRFQPEGAEIPSRVVPEITDFTEPMNQENPPQTVETPPPDTTNVGGGQAAGLDALPPPTATKVADVKGPAEPNLPGVEGPAGGTPKPLDPNFKPELQLTSEQVPAQNAKLDFSAQPETSVHGHEFEDADEAAKFLGISKDELLTGGKPWQPETGTPSQTPNENAIVQNPSNVPPPSFRVYDPETTSPLGLAGEKYGWAKNLQKSGEVSRAPKGETGPIEQAAIEAQEKNTPLERQFLTQQDLEGMPPNVRAMTEKAIAKETPQFTNPDDPLTQAMLKRFYENQMENLPEPPAPTPRRGLGDESGAMMISGQGPGPLRKAWDNFSLRGMLERIPQYERASLLFNKDLPTNVFGAPTGLAFHTGLEKALEGDPKLGWEIMKRIPGIPGRTWNIVKSGQAANVLEHSPLNVSEALPMGQAKTKLDQMIAAPATAITGAHMAGQDALIDAGIPQHEAAQQMLSVAPAESTGNKYILKVGQGAQAAKTNREPDPTTGNIIMNTLWPFTRTASIVAAETPSRLPFGLNALSNKLGEISPLTARQLAVRTGISSAEAPIAYMIGNNIPPEDAPYVRKWVRNLSGKYGLVNTAAFEAGLANQKGGDPVGALGKGFINGLPLPTGEAMEDWFGPKGAIPQLMEGNPVLPRTFVPGILQSKQDEDGVIPYDWTTH